MILPPSASQCYMNYNISPPPGESCFMNYAKPCNRGTDHTIVSTSVEIKNMRLYQLPSSILGTVLACPPSDLA